MTQTNQTAMSPIDLEIYWNRLIAITDEAGATLKRTSFSTVVRESNDFACVLLDTEVATRCTVLSEYSWFHWNCATIPKRDFEGHCAREPEARGYPVHQ
jgi:phosphatidylethanolamine-binding protein (PEBP) family uncharacterized protein